MAIKKSLTLDKNNLKTVMDNRQETGPKAEQGEDRRSNRTRQNNKRAARKMESNDSPDIPDRGGGRHQKHPASLWPGPKERRSLIKGGF